MPDAKVTFPTVVVPARRLAAQWLAVFNAAGNNKTEFTTYRAVAVEFFPDQGVRLVAMNEGHTLILRAFVPCWHLIDSGGDAFYDEPPPDEAPIRTIIVRDINRRVTGLMKHLLSVSDSDASEDSTGWPVTLAPGLIEPDGDEQRLGSLFDEWGCIVTSPREKVCVEVLDEGVAPPNWRDVNTRFEPGEVLGSMFHQDNLRALAAISGAEWGAVRLDYQGDPCAPVMVRVVTNHGTVHGVLAPMQREQVAEQDVDDETRRQLTAEVEEFARFAAELPADPDFDDEPDAQPFPEGDLPRGTFNPDDPDDDEPGSFLDELDDGP